MAFSRVSVIELTKPWWHLTLRQVRHNGINSRLYSKGYIPRKNNLWFLSLMGIGTGACVGAGYSYRKYKEGQKLILNEQTENNDLTDIPVVEISRQVIYPSDTTGLQLTLFQYATCPFCCKVRAFLDYYGISYNVVEVNPVMRQQIKWSKYKKVPIIIAQHNERSQQLNDSSMIISALMSYLLDQSESLHDIIKYYPSMMYNESGYEKSEILNRYFLMRQGKNPDEKTKEAVMLERRWRKWVDEIFVHVLSPNVYRTREEAFETFEWFAKAGDWDKHFSPWERRIIINVGANAMWLISKRLKKRHHLKDDVRQSFYDECNVWIKALHRRGTPFMGGDKPNLADLAMYGVLNSIEGSRGFKDVLRNTKLGVWYWSVQALVQNHKGSDILSR